ncbi:hypothetical protein KKA17_03605, partial [bacterium]|nr:hypothetical protein [bacterium]MBU1883505.1 hypothetical protein [bacterium]
MNYFAFITKTLKKIRIENIVVAIIIALLSFFLYAEFLYKKKGFMDEKIYDLQVQYQDKVFSNKKYADT